MKLIANLSEIDRKTVLKTGITLDTLMDNAGAQVALAVQSVTPKKHKGVLICGPGNNGGDGFVCARKLYEAGYQNLTIIYTGENYQGACLLALEKLMIGLPISVISAVQKPEMARFQIQQAEFIVDALFGSGLNRKVTGLSAELIAAMNQRRELAQCPVISVDVPSGLDAATGGILGVAVQATHTVTFATGKPGLYLYPGKGYAGAVSVVDIGIPAELIAGEESLIRLITHRQARHWLPERKPDCHKYHYGNLLVIAGSGAMPGAAVLASESAMSGGAGLVTLAAPASVFEQVPLMPEIIRLRLPARDHLDSASIQALQAAFSQKPYNAVIIGPGVGQSPEMISALHGALDWLKALDIPVIVDADALNALAKQPITLTRKFILTPHGGECARLLNLTSAEVSANLLSAAQQARQRYGATVVLKAASTVIASYSASEVESLCWISPTGNAGMATAGSGDVLSGLIGALAAQKQAQGQPIWQSAALGVYLHGLAGAAAAEERTPFAMRASDLTRHFPHAFRQVAD